MTTKTAKARSFRPAPRILALIMGVSLIIVGLAGLAWHLTGQEHWLVGENIGLDIFHVVMGVFALGAGRTERSAKGFGGFAFVVFLVASALSALGAALMHRESVPAGVPGWLADNALGFGEVNYIVYLLMALWGLLLTRLKSDVDPWGSGDAHETLRAMPDREDAIEAGRRELVGPDA